MRLFLGFLINVFEEDLIHSPQLAAGYRMTLSQIGTQLNPCAPQSLANSENAKSC
jgi:hypothetical protein